MDLDLVIANGTVVDGTGQPAFRADVGVRDGRVAVVARERAPLAGHATLDATGLVVAPGFVELDSHADWALADRDGADRLLPLLRQGVTTVVGGACGFSPAPALPGRHDALDGVSRFLHDGPPPRRFAAFGELLDAVAAEGLAERDAAVGAGVHGEEPARGRDRP